MPKTSDRPLGPDSRQSEINSKVEEFADTLANLARSMDAGAFNKIWPLMETGEHLQKWSFISDQPPGNLRHFKKSFIAGDETKSLEFPWDLTEFREQVRATQRLDESVLNISSSRGNEALANDSFKISLIEYASAFITRSNLRGEKGPSHTMFDVRTGYLFPLPEPKSQHSGTPPHDAHHHHHHPKVKEPNARNHFKPEFTSLEKMGFIMSGNKVQNPYDQRKIDLLQQIARNTSVQTVGRGWGAQDPNHTIRDSILETNAL